MKTKKQIVKIDLEKLKERIMVFGDRAYGFGAWHQIDNLNKEKKDILRWLDRKEKA